MTGAANWYEPAMLVAPALSRLSRLTCMFAWLQYTAYKVHCRYGQEEWTIQKRFKDVCSLPPPPPFRARATPPSVGRVSAAVAPSFGC